MNKTYNYIKLDPKIYRPISEKELAKLECDVEHSIPFDGRGKIYLSRHAQYLCYEREDGMTLEQIIEFL